MGSKYFERFLFILANIGFQIIPSETLKTQEGVCICPGIDKPVCHITPSGALHLHPNLCQAQCISHYGNPIQFIPGTLCSQLQENRENSSSFLQLLHSPEFQDDWFRETDKEIKFYSNNTINRYLERLLKAIGVPLPYGCNTDRIEMSKMQCVCPPFQRPYTTVGPSGNLIRYDNLCVALCSGRTNIVLFPWFLLQSESNPEIAHPGVVASVGLNQVESEAQFNRTLLKWKESMENEIQFWEEISTILRRLN